MTEPPASISSIVDTVFTDFISKQMEKDDGELKDKKTKHKSHKEKHKKHKHKEKSKDKDDFSKDKDSKSKKHKDKRSKSGSRERDAKGGSVSREFKDNYSSSGKDTTSASYPGFDEYGYRIEEYSSSRCKDKTLQYDRHSSQKEDHANSNSYCRDEDSRRSQKDYRSSKEPSVSSDRKQRHTASIEKATAGTYTHSSLDRLQDSDSSDSAPPTEGAAFFAKEGFLHSKSKKEKKHKKHKKEHKHKHKHKSKSKDKNKLSFTDEKLSFTDEKLSFTAGLEEDESQESSGSGVDTPKNEKANEFERDLREKLNSMKDNLSKKHKALEDFGKTQPSPNKKIKLCTEISLVDKYGDKERNDSPITKISESKPVDENESRPKEVNGNEDTDEQRSVKKTGSGKIQIQLSTISLPAAQPPKQAEPDEIDEDGFKMMIPRSVKLSGTEEMDTEEKTEVVKPVPQPVPPPAKKTMNLKISAISASLISSGVIVQDPKKKHMEDGELSDSQDSTKSSGTDVSSGSLMSSDLEDEDTDGEIREKKRKKRDKKKKKKEKKSKSSRSRSPKKSKRRSRSRSFDEERGVWKSESRSRGKRSRSKDRSRRSRDNDRDQRRSRSRDRRRSRERDRRRSPGHGSRAGRDRGDYGHSRGPRPFYARGYDRRSRSRSRERSRRRSKTPEDLRLKIDRVQLREIAMKNAYAAVHAGRSLQTLQPDQIAALKAGGKSLEELTGFCKQITEKEAMKAAGHMSDEETSDLMPDSDEPTFINHPFAVREPTNMEITMRIRNAKQLPVSSFAVRQQQSAELRVQFPVSSGTVHKDKEDEWTPVVPPAAPAKPVKEEKEAKDAMLMPPPPPPGKPPLALPAPAAEPDVMPAKPEEKVFPDRPEELAKGPINIGAVVSERLSAMRKLQDNPYDVEAMGTVHKAQKAMDNWALSKSMPGAWMGGTGIQKGSGVDLHKSGFQAWAKKDQLISTVPLKGGIGMALLQKMGWRQGEGLGKLGMGDLEPLQLDVKIDRRGLVSEGESLAGSKVKAKGGANAPIRDLSGKHPVSALMELAKKRRWGPPVFDLAFEHGPAHKKNFLFKVKMDDTWYQPTIASNNKKHAKCQAAAVALQSYGLLPKDAPI